MLRANFAHQARCRDWRLGRTVAFRERARKFRRQKFLQKIRLVAPPAALAVAPESFRRQFCVECRSPVRNSKSSSISRASAMLSVRLMLREKPVAEAQENGTATVVARRPREPVDSLFQFRHTRDASPHRPNQRRGGDEIAAVADQIPILRKAPQPLHRGEINQLVLQNFVGRMRVVNHLPFRIVPDNGRAAQAFQNADLDFLRAERDEPVKAGGETFHRFTGQADNQIGVNVDARFRSAENENCPRAVRNSAAG